MNFYAWLNFAVALLAIANPFGNLAIFIGLTSKKTSKEQRKIAVTSGIAVLITLVVIVWAGDYILKFFAISISAFQLAGGLIITLVGLTMLQSKKSAFSQTEEEVSHAKSKDSIAVVPLAIPIVAGPGAFTTVMINSHHFPHFMDRVYSSGAVVAVTFIVTILLFFAAAVNRMLGEEGINIATRVMGLILVAMAMQMLIGGLQASFPAWTV